MDRVRLDTYITQDIRDYIAVKAEKEAKPLYVVTEELLRDAILREQSGVIEREALPQVRDILQEELLRAMSAMRMAVRDDMQALIIPEMKEHTSRGVEKLGLSLVRNLRDVGIIRRLVYSLLAKAIGVDGAQKLYLDAKEKASQELTKPITEAEGDA